MRPQHSPILTAEQRQQVETLNRRLFDLEVRLKPLFETETQPHLDDLHRRYPQLPPFDDFNKEVEILLYLAESDPDYRSNDELILGRRTITLTLANPFWADGKDHRVEYRTELDQQGIGPVCWLFYEFYNRDAVPFQQAVPLRDMARVGMITVDIVTTDQLVLLADRSL